MCDVLEIALDLASFVHIAGRQFTPCSSPHRPDVGPPPEILTRHSTFIPLLCTGLDLDILVAASG